MVQRLFQPDRRRATTSDKSQSQGEYLLSFSSYRLTSDVASSTATKPATELARNFREGAAGAGIVGRGLRLRTFD